MAGQCPALTSDLGDILSELRSSCQGAKQKQNVNGGTWHSLLILEFRFKKKQQIIFSIYLEFQHCSRRLSSDQTGQKLCSSSIKLAVFLLFLCVWRRSRSILKGKSSSGLSWGPAEQGQVLLPPFWFVNWATSVAVIILNDQKGQESVTNQCGCPRRWCRRIPPWNNACYFCWVNLIGAPFWMLGCVLISSVWVWCDGSLSLSGSVECLLQLWPSGLLYFWTSWILNPK